MKRAILSAALAVAFVAGVSVQDRPNLVGRWKIDSAMSNGAGGLPETITVEGSKMTVTRTAAGNSESTVYLLDGTPSKNLVGIPGKQTEIVYTSKWDGNVLVTTNASPMMTRIEKRSIEADGTMKVEVTFNFTREAKSETITQVFKKVG